MLTFRIGAPPENTEILTSNRWHQLSGYDNTNQNMLRVVLFGFIVCAFMAAIWIALIPSSLTIGSPPLSSGLLVFFLILVVHELLHILAFPNLGFNNTVVGIWPQMGSPYMQYLLPVTRNRFIFAASMPFIVLSVLPLLAALAGFPISVELQWTSVINGFGAGADLMAVVQILRQTTSDDLVLDSGHKLYVGKLMDSSI